MLSLLCIINEMFFPKQPGIQVVPKHSRVKQRVQKTFYNIEDGFTIDQMKKGYKKSPGSLKVSLFKKVEMLCTVLLTE